MLKRQKILLSLLNISGGRASRITLFKLAFLLSEEGQSEQLQTFYEFMPYLYGPYSFTLNHELDTLLRSGLINFVGTEGVELTSAGRLAAGHKFEPTLIQDLTVLEAEYARMNQKSLVNYVYDKFPAFTMNSSKPANRKTTRPKAKCANYTVGYQSLQVDGLLNILLQQGIERLIDTRLNPVARRYGFHKSTLTSLCHKAGIEYIHAPEFGVPSEWRQELNTEQDYLKLFKRYEKEVLDSRKPDVFHLSAQMIEKPSALLCRELDGRHCHRSRLAQRLFNINGLPVTELCNYERAI